MFLYGLHKRYNKDKEVCMMFVDYIEMGKRIAQRRKKLGLKQKQVVEAANLSEKYLSAIENAKSIPSIDVLMKICTVLKTTPDYILLGAVDDYRDINYDDLISDKIKNLPKNKQFFVYNFIDWLAEQNI